MTYTKLESLARGMSAEQAADTLKQLCNDPRMAAVVRLIQDEKEKVSDDAAQPRRALHHGVLAHAAGSRHQLTELENHLRNFCTPEKTKRKPAPQADAAEG